MKKLLFIFSLLCSLHSWTQSNSNRNEGGLPKVDVYQTSFSPEHKLVLRHFAGRVAGNYLGVDIRTKTNMDTVYSDTTYYVAELTYLALSEKGDISFILTSFRISHTPLKIDSYGNVQNALTEDGAALFPAALYSYRFFGHAQENKIVLKRVANTYDSRAHEFVFARLQRQ